MKQLLLLIFGLLPALSISQPEITSSIYPLDGTKLMLADCDILDPQADNIGSNVIWDFSDLSCDSEPWILQFNNAAGSVNEDIFPEANKYIEIIIDGDTVFLYNILDESNWGIAGVKHFFFPVPIVSVEGKVQSILKFPAKFEDTWTNDFMYAIPMGDTLSSVSDYTVDGYGTLILPNGTYENVMRIHSIRTNNIIFSEETYTYYSPEYQYHLLHMLVNDEIQYQIEPLGTTSNHELEISNKLKISPNPGPSNLVLKIELDDERMADLYLFSIHGQSIISKKKIQFSDGACYLSSNKELEQGIYVVQIHVNEVIYTSKLIIQ